MVALTSKTTPRATFLEKEESAWLTQRIRKEVKAQLKRIAMAKTRDDFINRLVEVLIPALKHHYRAVLGQLNQRTDQMEKWRQQQEGFLDEFTDRLQETTKAKGLDERKAVAQACKEVMEKDSARRRIETRKFQTTYKLKKVVPLDENAHEQFFAEVREIVDTIFPT